MLCQKRLDKLKKHAGGSKGDLGEWAGDIILSLGGDLLPELRCSDGSVLYLWDTDIRAAF